MRTYQLTVSYDGGGYQGWQRQTSTSDTVQQTIEEALTEVIGYPVSIDGSGRTDAGVHAFGQTASFALAGKIDEKTSLEQLNERLPKDIRALELHLAPNSFHARKSACAKCYEYHLDLGQKQNVFMKGYACHWTEPLSIPAMQKAAGYLIGTHDFTSFTDKKDEKSKVRTIYRIGFEQEKEKLVISYYGNGFMYHMVRILSGTLLEIGSGRKQPEEIRGILQAKDRSKAGFLAAPQGLFLKEVYYEMPESFCQLS